jgi:hypothetical protein
VGSEIKIKKFEGRFIFIFIGLPFHLPPLPLEYVIRFPGWLTYLNPYRAYYLDLNKIT